MKILQGKRVRNYEEAVGLAFQEAGVGDMSSGVTDLLSSTASHNKLRREAEKTIATTVRGRYRKNPTWDSNWWCIPIPTLHYDTRDIPHLTIEMEIYLVAAVQVETTDDFYSITLVGPMGNTERLVLLIPFLLAILDNELDRFRLVAKDATHTTWDVPGAKPLQLPNDFLDKVCQILQRKSVAAWLMEDFGSEGRNVAPQVVGTLWGLRLKGTAPPLPTGQQAWTREFLINALAEGMAYKIKEAEEMFNRGAPYLKADHTNEEALRIILQQAGRGNSDGQ